VSRSSMDQLLAVVALEGESEAAQSLQLLKLVEIDHEMAGFGDSAKLEASQEDTLTEGLWK
jgi:hypothetical protein